MEAVHRRHRPPSRHRTDGPGIAVVLVSLLAALIYAGVTVRVGFNPTDDGFILAQARRLLDGQVPHVDIVSPRPLGSPILHAVTFALPTPLLVTSRCIALGEVTLTSWLLVRLLETGGSIRLGRFRPAFVAIATVVSLHTFPLMAWHTIDGVLLVAAGLVLLERGEGSGRWVGFASGVLLGASVVVKQSFAPAVVLGAAWVAVAGHRRGAAWVVAGRRRGGSVLYALAVYGLGAVVPGALYVLRVAAAGGLGTAREQLGAGAVPEILWLRHGLEGQGRLLVPLAAVVGAGRLLRARGPIPRVLDGCGAALAVLLAALAAVEVWDGDLALAGMWSAHLWWLAAGVAMVTAPARRRVDLPAVAVLALGWMATLSWGYAVPSLVAGPLLVLAVLRAVGDVAATVPLVPSLPAAWSRWPGAGLGCVAVVAALVVSVDARRELVYRDVPARAQVSAAGVAPDLWGVTTNGDLLAALDAVGRCLQQHPADQLAIVPDGAVVPLLFHRPNPLPVAWWFPPEVVVPRAELLASVETSLASGSHLVLFQTFPMQSLAGLGPLPAATPDLLFEYPGGYARDLFERVPGVVVQCGPYLGRYQS